MPLRLTDTETSDFAGGHAFGDTGAYELISGKVRFAADPGAAANADVVDMGRAPRDPAGLVRFSADYCLLKPKDMGRGNRRLFFDYGNRGNKRALQFFNDAPANNAPATLADAGNGFLMRQGYTVAWLAWEGDLLPGGGRLVLDVPTASEAGAPITGAVRVEFVATAPGCHTLPLSTVAAARAHPPVSLDPEQATMTRRRYADSRRLPVAPSAWSFTRIERGSGVEHGPEVAIVPSDGHVTIAAGFEPGWIYELIYRARDPMVLGLGHVAVRDFVTFLRHAPSDADGSPNPLLAGGGTIERAYAWGRSQTGRCIRDFVYLGFNDDGAGRRVFDGVLPHVAGAGKAWLNHRFANAVLLSGCEYENHDTVVDRFPFAYASSVDHLTGVQDAILKRPETDPLVIHTDTSSEYWNRRASLVVTDTSGQDLEPPDTVRIYLWAGSQHFATTAIQPPVLGLGGLGVNYENVVSSSMLFRGALVLLDDWVSTGRPPPPSRHPRRADGTLVPYEAWRAEFPAIPGVAVPLRPSRLRALDFGPDIAKGIIGHHPPRIVAGSEYAVLVPAVDQDGIDIAGVKAPMAAVPLGTYLGWNLRRSDLGKGAMLGVTGSYIPFADDADERVQSQDPRFSVAERFVTAADYVAAIRLAAEHLVASRFMLAEDLDRAVAQAADWGKPRHVVRLPGGLALRP